METGEIVLCLGSSCYTRGNNETLNQIQVFLKTNNLADKVTFKGELCSCDCKHGPNLKFEGRKHHNINTSSAIKILTEYFKEKELM